MKKVRRFVDKTRPNSIGRRRGPSSSPVRPTFRKRHGSSSLLRRGSAEPNGSASPPSSPGGSSVRSSPTRRRFYVLPSRGLTFEYVGCCATRSGLPHGRGELYFPDGSVFSGQFESGQRTGMGSHSFGEDKGSAFGDWDHDNPVGGGMWKVLYGNGDVYFGPLKVRRGRKSREQVECVEVWIEKESKRSERELLGTVQITSGSCFVEFEIEDFVPHGANAEYVSRGCKFNGAFVNGKRKCQFGIEVFMKSHQRYFGTFDEFYHGRGTFVYSDGSFYTGNWRAGRRFGKGTLYLCNGYVLEGRFNGDEFRSGTIVCGSVGHGDVSVPMVQLLQASIDRVTHQRGDVPFSETVDPGQGVRPCPPSDSPPNFIRKWESVFDSDRLSEALQQIELQVNPGATKTQQFTLLKSHLQVIIRRGSGYLSELVKRFCSCFQVAFVTGVRSGISKQMIPHAMDDVYSFIMLFRFHLSKIFHGRAQLRLLQSVVTSIIHDRIYDSLFRLYQVKYEKEDLILREKIKSLDVSLQAVGCPEWYCPLPLLGDDDDDDLVDLADDDLKEIDGGRGRGRERGKGGIIFEEEDDDDDDDEIEQEEEGEVEEDEELASDEEEEEEEFEGESEEEEEEDGDAWVDDEDLEEVTATVPAGVLAIDIPTAVMSPTPTTPTTPGGSVLVPIPPYKECIEMLEDLRNARNAREKLGVFCRLRETVMLQMQEYRKAFISKRDGIPEDRIKLADIGMDDLAPVYCFIFLKSTIQNHTGLYRYLVDWNDLPANSPANGLLMFYGGFVKKYVLSLDPALKTRDGVYISVSQIESAVELGIRRAMRQTKLQGFLWVPSVLLAVSKEIGVSGVLIEDDRIVGGAGTAGKAAADGIHLMLSRARYLEVYKEVKQNLGHAAAILCAKKVGFNVNFIRGLGIQIDFVTLYPSFVYQQVAMKIISVLKLDDHS